MRGEDRGCGVGKDGRWAWRQNRENHSFAPTVFVCRGWWFSFFGFFSLLFVLICFGYPVTVFSLLFLVTREGES